MNRAPGRSTPPAAAGQLACALLALALLVAVGVAVARASDTPTRVTHTRVYGTGQVRFDGAGPEKWAQRWRRERRRYLAVRSALRRQRRALTAKPDVVEAINLACAVYGRDLCSTLWRKARCETKDTLSPRSWNPTPVGSEHATGLFQFLPSTWASTPFARFSIWSAYAQALAAGWMHTHGRGGEWSCR